MKNQYTVNNFVVNADAFKEALHLTFNLVMNNNKIDQSQLNVIEKAFDLSYINQHTLRCFYYAVVFYKTEQKDGWHYGHAEKHLISYTVQVLHKLGVTKKDCYNFVGTLVGRSSGTIQVCISTKFKHEGFFESSQDSVHSTFKEITNEINHYLEKEKETDIKEQVTLVNSAAGKLDFLRRRAEQGELHEDQQNQIRLFIREMNELDKQKEEIRAFNETVGEKRIVSIEDKRGLKYTLNKQGYGEIELIKA